MLFAALGVFLSEKAILDLDGTVFVQLAIFFAVFLVLRPLVFKPMLAVFAAREQAIDGAREEARVLEREALSKGELFDEELRRVRASANEERERLRAEGAKLERTMLDQVRRDSHEALESAKKRLDAEAARVRSELTATVPALSRQIADKLLGREVH